MKESDTNVTKTVAIYGGSFSPPHVGHAMVASWLLLTELVDEVWFVPVYRHAFEGVHEKRIASFEQRGAWCEALTDALDDRASICRIESELSTPSYTIDTLRALAERYPDHRFRLVVGSDVIRQRTEWKEWDSIAELFRPIVVARAGYASDDPLESPEFPEVSSSEIRRRIERGESVAHLVPAGVLRMLEGKGSNGEGRG